MRRLTKREWDLVNTALARYEAEDDVTEDEHLEQEVDVVRRKVWERLADTV
jgi:hypothetical protein